MLVHVVAGSETDRAPEETGNPRGFDCEVNSTPHKVGEARLISRPIGMVRTVVTLRSQEACRYCDVWRYWGGRPINEQGRRCRKKAESWGWKGVSSGLLIQVWNSYPSRGRTTGLIALRG